MRKVQLIPTSQWHRRPYARIGSLTGWFLKFACRPYAANEVFVTGTFDDWGKTVKLDRVGDIFSKTVSLPAKEKIQYKACNSLLFPPSRLTLLSFWPFCVTAPRP